MIGLVVWTKQRSVLSRTLSKQQMTYCALHNCKWARVILPTAYEDSNSRRSGFATRSCVVHISVIWRQASWFTQCQRTSPRPQTRLAFLLCTLINLRFPTSGEPTWLLSSSSSGSVCSLLRSHKNLLHQTAVQHKKMPARSATALGDWKVLRLERTHSVRDFRNVAGSNLDPEILS